MNLIWVTLAVACLGISPQDQAKAPPDKLPPKVARQPATLDEAIATALRHHPDVRVAEAEVQVAEAKLAQAKLLIAQKVTSAHADLAQAELATRQLQAAQAQVEKGVGSHATLESAEHQLQQARAGVALKEATLHALLGVPNQLSQQAAYSFSAWAGQTHLMTDLDVAVLSIQRGTLHVVPQSVAEKLKTALDTPVHMDKRQGVELEAYLQELLKKAGADLKVRLPATENKQLVRDVTKLDLDAGEYPLRVWLQLVLDETNNYRNMSLQIQPTGDKKPLRYDLYLREYGLLLSTPELAPPEAATLQQYYKQLQVERAAKSTQEQSKKP